MKEINLTPFDITQEDITSLDDNQLRDLMRRLLEAEASANDIPQSSISVGGHIKAADGGDDGSINWASDISSTDFIPRNDVIFQCKAESMTAGEITDEMAPKGKPRELFNRLIQKKGAYIIFSNASCSASMLSSRKSAMKKALKGKSGAKHLALDFYPADKIARWANKYQSIIIWLHELLGKPTTGWQAFGHWSHPLLDEDEAYLLNDKERGLLPNGHTATSADLIQFAREQLQQEKAVVRMVGLSGMGKTRLAETLFDSRVGTEALNKDIAVYGDISTSPDVSVVRMAGMLCSSPQEAILIVDNCPAKTHKLVTEILHKGQYPVSLLTIDFDVGKDQPEKTQVIRLEENGEDVIARLLELRFPKLSRADNERLVAFSGGNARIALALAKTAIKGGTLSDLNDEELLNRLFLDERKTPNERLKRCIEAASLVNAFYIDGNEEEINEAKCLASFSGYSYDDFFRSVTEGLDLGIVQQRGNQRSVLPHGLAYIFARKGLTSNPPAKIQDQFFAKAPNRLLYSFIKRLGNFHDLPIAVNLAEKVLEELNKTLDLHDITDEELERIEHIAPLVPETILSLVEHQIKKPKSKPIVSQENFRRHNLAQLIHKIAYDEHLFERSADVLLEFAKNDKGNHDSTDHIFQELFMRVLSGTNASPTLRFEYLGNIIQQGSSEEVQLSLGALTNALKTSYFTSSHSPKFGARSRNHGWQPKDNEEFKGWYVLAINLIEEIINQDGLNSRKAANILGGSLRGLFELGFSEMVFELIERQGITKFWFAGWKEICEALYFDRAAMGAELCLKIESLELQMRPQSLESRFEAYVLEPTYRLYDPNSTHGDGSENMHLDLNVEHQKLAKELLLDAEMFDKLILKLFAQKTMGLSSFGFGKVLAHEAGDLDELWSNIKRLFKSSNQDNINCSLLNGIFHTCNEITPTKVQEWLDEVINDVHLQEFIGSLSSSVTVGEQTLKLLTKAAKIEAVPLWSFANIACGSVTKESPSLELGKLIETLCDRGPKGVSVACQILSMQFHLNKEAKGQTDPILLSAGEKILLSHSASSKENIDKDHNFGVISEVCLREAKTDTLAKTICDMFIKEISNDHLNYRSSNSFAKKVLKHSPEIFIGKVIQACPDDMINFRSFLGMYDNDDRIGSSLFSEEEYGHLLTWIKGNPEKRAPKAAQIISYVKVHEDCWNWSPIAMELLNLPNKKISDLLEVFSFRFRNGGSSGGWDQRYRNRLPLIREILNHPNSEIKSWAKKHEIQFIEIIKSEEKREKIAEQRFE